MKPEEFDEAFEKWLKERFKPFRDKQRPSDYGKDLSPNQEKTPFTQVFAFAASPSGEIIAALTGNRVGGRGRHHPALGPGRQRHQEPDQGLHRRVRGRWPSTTPSWPAAPSTSRPPATPSPSSPARERSAASTWPRRSPATSSAASPSTLDQAQAPVPAARRQGRAPRRAQGRRVRHLPRRPRDGGGEEPDPGRVLRHRPPGLPGRQASSPTRAGSAATTRCTSSRWPTPRRRPSSPSAPTTTTRPSSPPTGASIFYSSTEDDDIYNLRSLDLKTGIIRQYTDVLGGNTAPEPLFSKGAARVGFISYFKGEFKLHSIEIADPVKEVEQEVQVAADEPIDFQPDVTHQVVAENKRRKKVFEKLYLEGRPPLNVGRDLERRLLRRHPGRPRRRAGGQELPVHRDLAAGVPQLRGHLHRPRAPAALRAPPPSTARSSSTRRPTTCSTELLPRGRLCHPARTAGRWPSRSTPSTSSIASICRPASSRSARASPTRWPSRRRGRPRPRRARSSS